MLEAAYLRLTDEEWREVDGGLDYEVSDDGVVTTGDPVIDAWERSLHDE